jgi:hypothetical protein
MPYTGELVLVVGDSVIREQYHGENGESVRNRVVELASSHGATHCFEATDRYADPVLIFVAPNGLTVGFANVFEESD